MVPFSPTHIWMRDNKGCLSREKCFSFVKVAEWYGSDVGKAFLALRARVERLFEDQPFRISGRAWDNCGVSYLCFIHCLMEAGICLHTFHASVKKFLQWMLRNNQSALSVWTWTWPCPRTAWLCQLVNLSGLSFDWSLLRYIILSTPLNSKFPLALCQMKALCGCPCSSLSYNCS